MVFILSCPNVPRNDGEDQDGDGYDDSDMAILEEIALINELEIDDYKKLGKWTVIERGPRRVWKLYVYNRGITILPESISELTGLSKNLCKWHY